MTHERQIHPSKREDPATCNHAWEQHLWESDKLYCPYCATSCQRVSSKLTPNTDGKKRP